MKKKIDILIIDDSALVRQALHQIFSMDAELNVIGTAHDPYDAASQLRHRKPDVITLDIEMPKMDGLTFLKKIMHQHPIPVVVISTLTERNSLIALEALKSGAVDVIAKPKINTRLELNESSVQLCAIVKAAAQANLEKLYFPVEDNAFQRLTSSAKEGQPSSKILALGASTGGTTALQAVLKSMPLDCPGIVIVQHMPEVFTRQFANHLDKECTITIKEASDGDIVLNGQALIAPGDQHMLIQKRGAHYYVVLKKGQLVSGHRPSVDVLFKTVANNAGMNAAGCLMTGMGKDGANGLLQMRNAGGHTIAQNEATCAVFGMPREAISISAAVETKPLQGIAGALLDWAEKNRNSTKKQLI